MYSFQPLMFFNFKINDSKWLFETKLPNLRKWRIFQSKELKIKKSQFHLWFYCSFDWCSHLSSFLPSKHYLALYLVSSSSLSSFNNLPNIQIFLNHKRHHIPTIRQRHVREADTEFHVRSSLERQKRVCLWHVAHAQWSGHVSRNFEQHGFTWGIDGSAWPEVSQWYLQVWFGIGPNSEYGSNTKLFNFWKFYEYLINYFLKMNKYQILNSKDTISRNYKANLIFSPYIFKILHFNLYLKWIISIIFISFHCKILLKLK